VLFLTKNKPVQEEKVYIPEIGLIYRYGGIKKAPEGADFTKVEVHSENYCN
jgi:hypothetical protein